MFEAQIDHGTIAVFGGRHPIPWDPEYSDAFRLGSLLARAGYEVISGGYSGVMEAVSRGALHSGGTAIGVTMEIFGSLSPNPYLTREIRARDFFERLEIITRTARAFVAVRGGMGTLTEISLVWNMIQTKTIGNRALILLGGFWKPMLRTIAGHLVISQNDFGLLQFADTVDDALVLLRSGELGGSAAHR
jgi:uncharacterized protein (TIGR00730 family)